MNYSQTSRVVHSLYRGAVFGGEGKNTIIFSEIPQGERDLRILFYLIKKLILWRGQKDFRSDRSRMCRTTFVAKFSERPKENISEGENKFLQEQRSIGIYCSFCLSIDLIFNKFQFSWEENCG